MKPTYEELQERSNEFALQIQELEQQRDKLIAQVERLRECTIPAIKLMRATGELSGWHEKADLIESVISETQTTALAELKAQWQDEVLGEFYDHLQGMALRNGWNSDSDAYHVSEELKSWCMARTGGR